WFKKPGEPVAVDEPLVELETDKVTIEVPAPAAGVLADIAAKDGDTVAVGAVLGLIKEGAAGTGKSAPVAAASVTPSASPPVSAPRPSAAASKAETSLHPAPRRRRRNRPMRRSRLRCASSPPNPASIPRALPARAGMAASPRVTCSPPSNAPPLRRRQSLR